MFTDFSRVVIEGSHGLDKVVLAMVVLAVINLEATLKIVMQCNAMWNTTGSQAYYTKILCS